MLGYINSAGFDQQSSCRLVWETPACLPQNKQVNRGMLGVLHMPVSRYLLLHPRLQAHHIPQDDAPAA